MKHILAALFGAVVLQQSTSAFATTIRYEAIDLADTSIGDLWQYRYQISDHIFLANEGFSILFDEALYIDLEDPVLPPNGDWLTFSLPPDPLLPNPGRYDGLALVDIASLVDFFTINFNWLGAGSPGSQPFEIYSVDANGNIADDVETGLTIPMQISLPEPDSLALLASGLLGLALRRTRWQMRT